MFKSSPLMLVLAFGLHGCTAPQPGPNPVVVPPPIPLGHPAKPISRTQWAGDGPNLSEINPMTRIRRLTIHHDGLLDLFYASDMKGTASRLESIRQMHRNKGWSDIGYHYVLDRAGRLWEARPVRFQGAHVKNQNEGNVGILVLGNFQEHQPRPEQLKALKTILVHFQKKHGILKTNIFTHGELGVTTCPGKYLQPHVDQIRRSLP